MKIALIDVDNETFHSSFPNYALMKISAWHKANGDSVEWYNPLFSRPDRIYASKVFVFTKDYQYFPHDIEVVKGGTGYDIHSELPKEIDDCFPDYSIYPWCDYAIGFVTRGCIRNCPWCVVPRKEGTIHFYRHMKDLKRPDSNKIIMMDNNFLAASNEIIETELNWAITNKVRIDFNQALDARLLDEFRARILAKCRWIDYIRFACDTDSVREPLAKAVHLLDSVGYHGKIMIYLLAKEWQNALDRVYYVESLGTKNITTLPYIMPFRNLDKDEPVKRELKILASWCNGQKKRLACRFEEYDTWKNYRKETGL